MDIPRNVLLSCTSLGGGTITSPAGYSGLFIGRNWLITHGSALLPLLSQDEEIFRFVSRSTPGILTSVPENFFERLKFSIHSDARITTENSETMIVQRSGHVAAIWKCPLLHETLENLLKDWSFEKSRKFDRLILPLFLAIERRARRPMKTEERLLKSLGYALSRLADQASETPTRGSVVEIVSTPFGNPVFADSMSRGVVANVLGMEGCIVLTDANAYPGCEGGPLYILADGRICGMVIASQTSCRGEWVDYTFAVNLLPSLRRTLQNRSSDSMPPSVSPPARTSSSFDDAYDDAGILDESVAMIRCGRSWGTGILVDEKTGIFLTCAHVVTEAPTRDVRIVRRGNDASGPSMRATLIYRTDESKPYDVAVLRVNAEKLDPSMRPVKLSTEPARKGEQVLSVGFPLFPTSKATVSSGIVSKSLNCMLQTSCCAQSGSSGGPVLRRKNHEMLGMVVCNALSSNGSILYPRLSMAVPTSVLKDPLLEYLRTTDSTVLQAFTENDAKIQRTWKLHSFLPSNI